MSFPHVVSSLQRDSIHALWLRYDIRSDGNIVTIGGGLSLAIKDAGHNMHLRHHLKMIMGVEPGILQALIKEFEAELYTIETIPHFGTSSGSNQINDPIGPMDLLEQPSSATSSIHRGTNTCTELSPEVTPLSATLSISSNRAAKRPRTGPDGESKAKSIRCPGNKGQDHCLVSNREQWGQRNVFKKHFADEHMDTFKESDGGYRCVCNRTFSGKEDGRAAFTEHIWENPHTV